jgi:hypothetical protein
LIGSLKEIIARLEQQKAAIDRAIGALNEFEEDTPVGSSTPEVKGTGKAVKKATKKKRVMSEEGRRRIAEAQQKRWAKSKRAAKKLAKVA